MTKQVISLGSTPNGAGGDDRRSAWLKGKANFTELFNWLSGRADGDDYATSLPAALPVAKGGTGGTNQATARSGLGLGSAATRYVGTEPGQLVEKGAYGVGAAGGGPNVAPNSAFTQGFYTYFANSAGAPATASGGSLIVTSMGGNYVQQMAITIPGAINNPWIGIRHFDSGGNPGSWCKLYHTGNTTIAADGTLKAI